MNEKVDKNCLNLKEIISMLNLNKVCLELIIYFILQIILSKAVSKQILQLIIGITLKCILLLKSSYLEFWIPEFYLMLTSLISGRLASAISILALFFQGEIKFWLQGLLLSENTPLELKCFVPGRLCWLLRFKVLVKFISSIKLLHSRICSHKTKAKSYSV